MATEQVDALVLAARFDTTGLDESSRDIVRQTQNVSRAIQQASGAGAAGMSELAERSLQAAREAIRISLQCPS